jgi:hypothetical protein
MSRREKPSPSDAAPSALFDGGLHSAPPFDGDVRLLRSVLNVFDERQVDRLRTSVLSILPWNLARISRPFRFRPKTLRFVDRTATGHLGWWFRETIIRVAERTTGGKRQS